MKVNSGRDIPFKSFYTNKALKKGLEFAADNGSLFAACVPVAFAVTRPLSIWLTPKTDVENRKLAASKSIMSSLTGLGIMLGASLPLSNSIKKIDISPEKYLNKDAVKFYKNGYSNIRESEAYKFGTQIFKLGLGAIVAIPKAIITAAGLPYLQDAVFSKKNNNSTETSSNINFKGKGWYAW